MKKQGGFTLIELVVVIVILGILAVTAAPRFLNLQDDARDASLEGLRGAMAGAAGIVYGKAAIDGKENNPDSSISVDNVVIETVNGYPKATSKGIGVALSDSSDWTATEGENHVYYTFESAPANATSSACSVVYVLSPSDSQPTITANSCN